MSAEYVHTNLKIDTSLWKSGVNGAETGFAGVLLEQRKGELEERINYHELYIDINGEIKDKDTDESLLGGLRNITRLDALEILGARRMCQWAVEQNRGEAFCIWISAPSNETEDRESYVESRFVLWHLQNKTGRTEIEARGVSSNHSEQDCIRIANQISAFSNTSHAARYWHPDQMRVEPLDFIPPQGILWTKFLEGIIGEKEIWAAIESGQDKLMKQKAKQVSQQVMAEYYVSLVNAQTYWEQKLVQAQMERRAAELGMPTQCYGGCEILFNKAIKQDQSPLQRLLEGLLIIPCPRCGHFIVAGSAKCKSCDLTKKEYDRNRKTR